MDNAKQHWKILQELGNDLASKVRSFMVVGMGGNGVLVATEDGQGFWYGTIDFELDNPITADKPTPLNVPGLVQMAQSTSHFLLLNNRGEIYSMGENGQGQLGLGTVEEGSQFLPQQISMPQTKFTSVRCGQNHSVALADDGKVWAWGGNSVGQVGVPNSTNFLQSPRQILELDPHRIVSVECGSVHSLALTEQGEVYGWGCNNYGQLGDGGSERSKHTPTLIPTLSPVKSMAAGSFHTLLLTRTGEVYVCGCNESGQLGSDVRSSTTSQSSANLIKVAGLPPISQIASHYVTGLSIAMSSDQRCFVWGELRNQKLNSSRFSTLLELPSFYSTVESPLSFYSCLHNTPHSIQVSENPPSVSSRISRMFDNPETSDVQFVVEQRTIHAHRCILSNSSDYFARMFSETWLPQVDPEDRIVKVTIPDHSYRVFHTFLCLIYNDSLEVHPALLPELFDLSTQYLVPDLQKLCLSRMRTTLSPTTSCLYYPLTARHSLPELSTFQQDLVQFISTRTSEVYLTAAYCAMDAELCKQLTISMASLPPNHFPH